MTRQTKQTARPGYREDYGLPEPSPATFEVIVRVGTVRMRHTVTTTSYHPMRIAQLELEKKLGIPLAKIMPVTYREIASGEDSDGEVSGPPLGPPDSRQRAAAGDRNAQGASRVGDSARAPAAASSPKNMNRKIQSIIRAQDQTTAAMSEAETRGDYDEADTLGHEYRKLDAQLDNPEASDE
jgi:hypothetical protein